MTEKDIGARLKVLRKRAGKGQGEMAQALDMTVGGYSGLELGNSRLKVSRMLDICNILGLTPAMFFNDAPPLDYNTEQEIMHHVGSIVGPAFDIMEAINKLMVDGQGVITAAKSLKLGLSCIGAKGKRKGGKYL
jgi:transcriptional regulator with XRE-family HTH domain